MLALALQAIGAIAVIVGLFMLLSWPLALAIVGGAVLIGGTVLEVVQPRGGGS